LIILSSLGAGHRTIYLYELGQQVSTESPDRGED
jgi:hypothetical protein